MAGEDILDKKELTSEFNEAQLQLLRLNELWSKYHTLISEPNYRNANKTLNAIWIELTPDAKYKGMKKYSDGIALIDKKIFSFASEPDKLEKTLNIKAIFLKDLQEASGKGSKRKEKYEHM